MHRSAAISSAVRTIWTAERALWAEAGELFQFSCHSHTSALQVTIHIVRNMSMGTTNLADGALVVTLLAADDPKWRKGV